LGGDGRSGGDGKAKDAKLVDDIGVNDVIVASDGGCPISPDPTNGVFVSTGGMDVAACGSPESPCRTIGTGATRAFSSGKPILHVSQGTYSESVTLGSGLHIFGGYSSPDFKPICNDTSEAVVIEAPASKDTTVSGQNLDRIAQIANLMIMMTRLRQKRCSIKAKR
jgi:hypothetical protein